MFIAVLQENFEIAEEQKHKVQLQTFKRNVDPTEKKDDVIYRWNFYKYLIDVNGNLAGVFSSSVAPMEGFQSLSK